MRANHKPICVRRVVRLTNLLRGRDLFMPTLNLADRKRVPVSDRNYYVQISTGVSDSKFGTMDSALLFIEGAAFLLFAVRTRGCGPTAM